MRTSGIARAEQHTPQPSLPRRAPTAPDNFDKVVNGAKAALIEFYAPWYAAGAEDRTIPCSAAQRSAAAPARAPRTAAPVRAALAAAGAATQAVPSLPLPPGAATAST